MMEDHRLSASKYEPWVLPHTAVVQMQRVCCGYSGSLTDCRGGRDALVPRGADARRCAAGVLHSSCLAAVGPHAMTLQPELQLFAEQHATLAKAVQETAMPKVKNSIWDTSTALLPAQ